MSYCCAGMCVEILEKLAEELNFEYTLYEVPDEEWGVQDPVSVSFPLCGKQNTMRL